MRSVVVTFLWLWMSSLASAQIGQSERGRSNTVFGEWYGNGIYYSLNYERKIHAHHTSQYQTTLRIGAMCFPNVFFPGKFLYAFPLEVNRLFGKGEHKSEFGIGSTCTTGRFYHWVTSPQQYYRQLILCTRLGYRYEGQSGIICRIGILPLMICKLGYMPEVPGQSDFGLLSPSTSNLVNDRTAVRYRLGISAGISFGYSF